MFVSLRGVHRVVFLASAAALWIGGPATAFASNGDTAAPTNSGRIEADTPRVLPNGARFVAPRIWSIRAERGAFILSAPEGDSHIAIVDGGAGDADAAVAAAWAIYRSGFSAATQGTDRPKREGWDQSRLYRYPSPAGEARNVFALALRKGDRWTVLINDMTEVVAERRDGQLEVIFNSLLPQGYERETFAGRRAHRLDAARVSQLQELIETARAEFDIPGVALGLIQDGEVVFAGGFGVRELGRPEPVDADTLFNVASSGKPLTTLMLAKQVEAGRFGWDTPVESIWPEFRLGDPKITQQVRVRHLICACTGMPRQDYEGMFEGDDKYSTPASIMKLLSVSRPTSAFGDTYQYSNNMAAAAGFLGGHVLYPRLELGAAYDAAMQRLVYDPLGMTATIPVSLGKLPAGYAAGHSPDIDGHMRVTSQDLNYASISTRPSGNLWSNTRDLLRYVRMELARGLLPNGRRYIREDVLLARSEPQTTQGLNEYYGMGLKIDRQWGVPVIHHGGTAMGYRSEMIWLPDHNVGAVILINSVAGSQLRSSFRRRLLEILFDGQPIAMEQLKSGGERARKAVVEQRKTLTVPVNAEAMGRLAARYRNADLGGLEVRRKGDATWFDFGGWSSEIATQRGEDGALTFVTISPEVAGWLEFSIADQGGQRRLVTREGEREYVFSEVP